MTKINCFRILFITGLMLTGSITVKLNAQCTETFEAAALPAGWSAITTTDCATSNPWAITTSSPITGARSAFVNGSGCISLEVLYSRYYAITSATAQLSFSRRVALEPFWDGLVLEISVGGLGYMDIKTAGGTFVSGDYDGILFISTNPLGSREAWYGSTGVVPTVVNLPASANGQIVRFRWRRGTDNSGSDIGVHIDNISITGCATSVCAESFSTVTAPAIPAGWAAVTATDCANSNPWVTSTTSPDSPPNSAFVNAPECVSDEFLYSKLFQIISTTAQLTFRRNHVFENNADGMVLEISIDGAPFIDVITAGCTIPTGPYGGPISNCCNNPIKGRNAWTGSTGGWVNTTVNLPATANDKIVIFRWRRGTDNSIGTTGAYIDGISVAGSLCNTACSGSILLSQSASSLCNGSVVLTATGGGTSFQWFKNNELVAVGPENTLTASTIGIYYAKSLLSGCMVTSNIIVVEAGTVTPTLEGTGVYCLGSTVNITIPATQNNQEYKLRQNGNIVFVVPVGSGGGNKTYTFIMDASKIGEYRAETSIPGCLTFYSGYVYIGSPAITGLQPVSVCQNEAIVKWNRVIPEFVFQNYEYELSLSSTPGFPAGQTSDTSLIFSVSPFTTYYCHVRSSCGISSFGPWSTISFTTNGAGGSLSLSPASANLCAGPIELTVSGGGPVYQWYRNDVLIAGANGSTFTASLDGLYVAKSMFGTCLVSSNSSSVVTAATVFPIVNGDGSYCTGSNADIQIEATEVSQDYKWILNGVVERHIPIGGGGGNQSLNVAVTAATEGLYIIETFKAGCPVETNSVYVEMAVVTNLYVTTSCPTEVSFEWDYLMSGMYQYEVSTSGTPPAIPSNPPTFTREATVTGLTPSTLYYIHVRGAASGGSFCNGWTTISFTTPAVPAIPVTSIWTGEVNTSWTDPGNWQCGFVPGTTTEVIVDGGLPNYPVITTNKTIRKLTANPNASVTVSPGVILTITGN